jgi:Protein of unknown function (DUF2844)
MEQFMPERASEISGIGQPLTEKVDSAAMNGPGNDPASWSSIRKDIGYNHIRSHYPDRPKRSLMRAAPFFSALLLAYAGVSHAALGGPPEQFNTEGTTVASSVSSAVSNYVTRDTTLAAGTHVREFVSGSGVVFAVTWDGPFLPDLKALLGKYFATMGAESAKVPRAGRSHMAIDLPEVVINSGGHMRAFEGSAWIPAEFPAGFTADDVR